MIEDFEFSICEESLQPGNRVVLFTDGLFEIPDPGGEEFGRDRVADILGRSAALATDALLDTLLHEAEAFGATPDFSDDVRW